MAADLVNPIFTDADKAREHLQSLRWPNGPVCPHCGNADPAKVRALQGKAHRKGLFQCAECREQFTVIVTNLELDGVEEFLQYDGYPGEAPVVSIISKYPDHPVYDYARSHPELFTPVADFSCWIDGESLYRGPAPIPEEVLERLRRG